MRVAETERPRARGRSRRPDSPRAVRSRTSDEVPDHVGPARSRIRIGEAVGRDEEPACRDDGRVRRRASSPRARGRRGRRAASRRARRRRASEALAPVELEDERRLPLVLLQMTEQPRADVRPLLGGDRFASRRRKAFADGLRRKAVSRWRRAERRALPGPSASPIRACILAALDLARVLEGALRRRDRGARVAERNRASTSGAEDPVSRRRPSATSRAYPWRPSHASRVAMSDSSRARAALRTTRRRSGSPAPGNASGRSPSSSVASLTRSRRSRSSTAMSASSASKPSSTPASSRSQMLEQLEPARLRGRFRGRSPRASSASRRPISLTSRRAGRERAGNVGVAGLGGEAAPLTSASSRSSAASNAPRTSVRASVASARTRARASSTAASGTGFLDGLAVAIVIARRQGAARIPVNDTQRARLIRTRLPQRFPDRA